MNQLAIWCPTYKRPDKLQDMADNLAATTKNSFTLYFGIEPNDHESIKAARKVKGAVTIINRYAMGYSNTIQTMYEDSKEPFWFHANDDFVFHPNWDEAPLNAFDDPKIMVVGAPQNRADTTYSAICFGRRSYIKEQSGVIDMKNRVFYPYNHNYIDTEFTRTAQFRGVWTSSSARCIDHLHPGILGGEKDDTYKKNDATAEIDKITFESREHLWEPEKEV